MGVELPVGLGWAGWRDGVKLETGKLKLEIVPGVGRSQSDPPWLAGERKVQLADARRGGNSRHPHRAEKEEFVKEAE